MRVTNKMLAKDLRFNGRVLRVIAQFNSESRFKRVQKLIIKLVRNHEPKDKAIEKKEFYIPRRDGEKLRLCVYCRKDLNPKEPVTGLLWIHGGGYAFGIPEIETKTIERFIQTSNTVVVSPDYRLSLEAPYPAALHDAYDVLVWMKENVTNLGIKDNQIFVGGESAGGGLACAVTAYARDKKTVNVAYQIPLYPMLDDRMLTQSMIDNDAPVWNIKANQAAWKLYLGEKFQTEEVAPYAAPARLTNYAGLPPTFTFISDIEPFYDETREYIHNLQKAGVNAEMKVYHGAFHGFDLLAPNSKEANDAVATLLKAYKHATEKYFA
ncbi:alpha/beta hydrolase [Companilactobacillus nantensis]|uniref:Esterase lipase n=1 Tax=Companilactobacillus nantensis DSM 16982 TaxID=1423774 RepID=A0A0R1WIZ5_9LACO|nr:alpha/beta hydrolase [Companilactobacillus nantensis]KRM14918.1 esterase lipase [Companilactobacillus nantensis DSM 16982]GEO64975.1 hypothetical protein LNA01_21580 [Companilactobacillus nantensis]